MMEGLERLLEAHPFLRGLRAEHVAKLAGCVANRRYAPGEFVLREGLVHGKLVLVRDGSVAIESAGPGGTPVTIETVGPGDVLGLSWLTPSKAHFDCRARESVLAFEIDNECLRAKMDSDPALGYALTSRLLENTYERLSRVRLQQLDLYR
jgi:CRP/FNR family transcriptional regulator, cyclic AMP receptor protein